MNRSDTILDFWFGNLKPDEPVPDDRRRLWFGGEEETDRLLRDRFGEDVEAAAAGRYDHWAGTARGRLALILLLDQFTRNIYRNSPQAFATDAKARNQALAGIEAGQDKDLSAIERGFFYLPLEHAEDLELQQISASVFRELLEDCSPAQHETCTSFYDYAVRHRDVIARFGRFPHRNRILGRSSTPEELEFLEQPGSSF